MDFSDVRRSSRNQSGLAPENLTTVPHLSVSSAMQYTRSISSDLWPVWSQIFNRFTPRLTAVVTRPERRLWAPKFLGSSARREAPAFTMPATIQVVSRPAPKLH